MHKRKVHFTGTRDHWIQFWLEGIVIARKGGSNGSPLPPDRVGHFAASANVCLTKCSVTSSCCQQRPRERVFQRLLAGT